MNLFKLLIFLIVCYPFLFANCTQHEEPINKNSVSSIRSPHVFSKIDSSKYKLEIFRLDTLFNKLYKANAFNGNVLIAKGSHIIYQKSFGIGNKSANTQLSDSSLFQLASVSKVVTGIAAMMLYEKGKLKLETKVYEILKGFPYTNISVRDLLSHRSGLPNYLYFCSDYVKSPPPHLSNQGLLDLIVKYQPKPFLKPGKRFNYNNTNYALLALIIEKISGKKFSVFLKEELFKPLGMRHTYTALDIDSTREYLTQGHTLSYARVANDWFDGVLGDKGIYTTTFDLFLLSAALYQQRLLNPETQCLAYTPHSPEKKESNYGFGWRMKNLNNDDKEVYHNGWWHGYRTSFHRRLKDSLTVIVLSNRLNMSVYATGRVYAAIDGPKAKELSKDDTDE